ncbi:MAG: response regulator [Nitrospirae bacterium]|nr:response regulator [Nitrospirota bacterium]MCL5977997.1 response regulator [Nitrospirota bacterium]
MRIGQRIILAAGALISTVLLIQGAVSQIIIRNELKSVAIGHLTSEAKGKTRILNDLLEYTNRDISTMRTHKAFENLFTSRALNDKDGILTYEFELESFFINIQRVNPQYAKIQLTASKGEPILQITKNKRTERFDRYDHAGMLKQFGRDQSDTRKRQASSFIAIHKLLQDKKDGWVLLSAAPLIFHEKIEGLLWVCQPIDDYIKQTFSEISNAGMSYAISNGHGTVIAHSENIKSEIISGLVKGELSDWVIASEHLPSLSLKISMGIEKAKAFKGLNNLLLIVIGVLALSVISSMLILGIIARNISKPINNLVGWSERLSMGDLTLEDIKITNDEIGELNAGYKRVVNSFRETASICEAISRGDFGKTLDLKSEQDALGISVNKMINDLKKATDRTKRQNWLKNGIAELNDKMRGDQDIATLSQNIIEYLAAYLNAQIGALYLCDENNNILKLTGSYARPAVEGISVEYRIGEGLIGQAAVGKKPIIVTDIPDGYAKISSGMGEAAPRNIVVAPFLYEGKVKGVLEIGSFHEITNLHMEFLGQVLESIAISLNSVQSGWRIRELLEKTQQQTEELRIQQEELQQINEELEEQSQALERQKDDLQEKNEELETAKQMLEQKAEELALSSKYKSQFLANMSHELRTPLNSMLVLSQILMQNENGNLTERQVEYASTVHNAGSDLLLLISDILDLSKIEAGKMEIHHDKVSIEDFLANTEANFKHIAHRKGVSLKIEKSVDVPAFIITDRQRFEQVIRNFLSNAFKFTHKGGVALGIHRPCSGIVLKSTLEPSNTIAITVADTGIGIPKNKQDLIFEAFQQADGATSRHYGGTGLGLTISRDIAKLLGGEIQLQSVEGKGSSFTLYLPESPEKINKMEAERNSPCRAEPCPEASVPKNISSDVQLQLGDIRDDRRNISAGDRTVLIVEDDPRFAKILYDLAVERGFKGLIAGDGEAGLYLADYYKPGAVILDIGLPRIDGWTVMERLKTNPKTRHIPVHLISANDKHPEAMRMGAIGYLTKPVSLEKLNGAFDKIEHAVSKSIKNLLIVDDDEAMRKSIIELVGKGENIAITAVGTAHEAYELLKSKGFDCMILDLGLPDMSGFELLENIRKDKAAANVPVIIHTGRELTEEEDARLQELADSIIIKGAKSPERLVDETVLFLQRVEAGLPEEKRETIKAAYDRDAVLKDKKILVADDDMRNVFAMTSVLEGKDMKVSIAKNGKEALKHLEQYPDTDIVLMDIMMPEMDGYEAMGEIRKQKRFERLPIIAITAKAMRGDRNKCVEAGASDYLAKPIEVDKLLSLLRVWLYK